MDNTVILILIAAGMFAIIGGITVLSHIYNLNEIKSKTVGDGQHGTARFANRGELRKTYKYIPYEPKTWRKQAKKGKLKLPQGVILGVKKKKGMDYAMVDDDDVHTLMIGAAGCGKTAYWLYPNLEYACAAGMSFLTTDTKGDLYRNYGNIAKDYYGYDVAIIDLRNPTKSDGNNLLHLVNKYMDAYKENMEAIEKNDDKPDMVAAFKDFVLGHTDAKHVVAYRKTQLLHPVVFHKGVQQIYTNRSWTHKNIYGWPYEMHADRIEVEQAIITHEGKYHRCIKAKFINLAYENDLAEEDGVYTPIGKFWGHPNVFKKDWRDKKNRIIESRFFVSEDNYDTYKDAQEHMDEKYISFDCLMEDVFGDG